MINNAKTVGERDKLFNFRPALFAAISLAFGVVFGYYTLIHGVSAWWLLSLVPITATPLFFCWDKKDLLVRGMAVVLLLISFFLGFSSFRYQLYDYSRCGYYNGEHTVTGTVVNYVRSSNSVKLVLEDVSIDGREEKGTLIAYLPTSRGNTIQISDVVIAQGSVRTNTEYAKEKFNAYAINDGIRFTLYGRTECRRIGQSNDVFLLIRNRVEEVVANGMDETSAAVTLGILTGNTTKIDDGLLDNMRMGGIAHIFAVSGLHVGALYAFALLLFTKTKLKKAHTVVKFITLSLTLLFYAAICGFSPSIVRAITLCLVSYIMRSLGGSTDGLNTLGVAAIIILFFTPSALFEVGFQLSFAACFGIILFARRIGQVCDEGYKFFQKLRPRRYTEEEKKMLENGDTLPLTVGERFYRAVTSVLSASLAAQILTAPIQYLAFGYFSGWSFILNLFFVPLISAVFAGLLVLVLLACILPFWLSAYLLYIPVILLNVALLVFEIADFSSFLLVGVQLSGASCVCYYGGALFLTDKWNISKGEQKWLANGCFLCFFVILALLNL